MPPKRKAISCVICKTTERVPYTCPIDSAPYCSVVCFKKHKEAGCSSKGEYAPKESEDVIRKDEKPPDKPTKRLRDLVWPLEPDSSLWQDPLAKEDVKPLRHFEYEAIATSVEVRKRLARPEMLEVLQTLSSLPREKRQRERRLRLYMGLRPDPVPTSYKSNAGDQAFRSAQSLNRQAGSGGGEDVPQEDKKRVSDFIQVVVDVLTEARRANGEAV